MPRRARPYNGTPTSWQLPEVTTVERTHPMNLSTRFIATLTLCLVSSPGFAKPIEQQDNHPSRRARILGTFDLDGDGTLSESERAEAKKAMTARRLKRFDTNGDGVLDDSEKQAMKETRTARRAERKDRRHGTRRQAMLEQFDVNGDGTLDDDEKKSARKAHRHRHRGRRDGESPKRPAPTTDV